MESQHFDESLSTEKDFATKAIHTHLPREQWDGSRSVAPPITLSATYLMSSVEEVSGEWVYGRYGNPSRDQVELTLAAIEGDAKHALCFSSGMAAANAMLEATLGHTNVSGDHVVAIKQVYECLTSFEYLYNYIKTSINTIIRICMLKLQLPFYCKRCMVVFSTF